MSTMPARIDEELFEQARTAGQLNSRSATQQLSHWARIGRALEASQLLNHRDIARVLSGQLAYDTLSDPDQALVRVEWERRIEEARAGLDLSADFAAASDSWSGLDESGRVVQRQSE